MKKLALMLVMALPLMFSACGSDEETEVTLDMTSMSLNYGAEGTLKASEKDCVWTSSNDFVATVDNKGVVKGLHEGTATITVSKGNSEATCQVTVNTTNNNFTLPILDWNASISTIKSKVTGLTLAAEDEASLAYTTNGGFPIYVYGFTNGLLRASTLSVTPEMDEQQDLEGFLKQRYALVAEDETSFTYADGNSLASADIAVLYTYDAESESVIATWAPVDHTKSGEAFVNRDFHNAHINIVRELAK